jgi:hypothetical protein
MYYAWNWWWFGSFIIPMILIAWVIFAYGTGRNRTYRTYEFSDRDDFSPRNRADREMRRAENRGRGPRNYRRSEARILEDVCDQLTLDERVDATDIDVQVVDSKVVLRGTVATRAEKRVAESIADTVIGVADVENDLRVGMLAPSARTGAPQPSIPARQS